MKKDNRPISYGRIIRKEQKFVSREKLLQQIEAGQQKIKRLESAMEMACAETQEAWKVITQLLKKLKEEQNGNSR